MSSAEKKITFILFAARLVDFYFFLASIWTARPGQAFMHNAHIHLYMEHIIHHYGMYINNYLLHSHTYIDTNAAHIYFALTF